MAKYGTDSTRHPGERVSQLQNLLGRRNSSQGRVAAAEQPQQASTSNECHIGGPVSSCWCCQRSRAGQLIRPGLPSWLTRLSRSISFLGPLHLDPRCHQIANLLFVLHPLA